MSWLSLRLKAYFFRAVMSIGIVLDLYFSHPLPQRVSFTKKIKSTVSYVPGSIKLLFYTPPSYTKTVGGAKRPASIATAGYKHPLLINFHGGGFTLGNPRDDGRWATAVTSQTDAVVVSVGYRLAPEYPFPIGIEDCVSAILWLWEHADERNIDITKTALSGFSAGGNLTYAVSFRLHQEIKRLREERKIDDAKIGKLVSLVAIYGSVDWTQSRIERDASNPSLIPVIPLFLYKLFDDSYLAIDTDRESPLLSPGLAPDDLLRQALPDNLVLISCGGDQLMAETEKFRSRLKALGKKVDGYMVEGVGHGWDKRPSFKNGNPKRDAAYRHCVQSLQEAWKEV